jgi:GT2 family glycosyltransferase/glycosyltransferase involved in cell wall biosynthesis
MIIVPEVDAPSVSVVVVTYGRIDLVRQTLEALVERTPRLYELVVVDNASPDGTGEWLDESVRGATLIRLPTNVGFGAGANRGAMSARGRYLCFLNSDAIVHEGWLVPLVERLDAFSWVGAVVPRILNVDGTLQEAGSLVGSDGSTFSFGFGDDPDRPAYRYARVVDYASAACLVVRRWWFSRCGGFDPAYGVGYYEDLDLAFRLATEGVSTVYEPRSTVTHYRHGSSSAADAEAFVLANRGLIVARWCDQLARRLSLADRDRFPHRTIAAVDAASDDTILMIEDRVPHADRGSGDPRSALVVRQLAALWPRARVTLIAFDGARAEQYAVPLWAEGIEVVWGKDWVEWFEERRYHYSVVIVSRPHNHERFDAILRLTQPQAHRIYDAESLYFRRIERQAALATSPSEQAFLEDEARRMRDSEAAAMRGAELVVCVTEEERRVVESLAPGIATVVLPYVVHADPHPPGFNERSGLLFFGGFMAGPGSPNEDGARVAAEEVLPRLRHVDPSIVLAIVGADPTADVKALAGPAVQIVGGVDDPRGWLVRARVHLAPLRFGAGIKLKLLDSMAAGLPFVTTPIGAEGLGLGDLARVVVGEDPGELAHLTRRLYCDPDLWTDVSAALLDRAGAFGLASFRSRLAEAMVQFGLAPPERQPGRRRLSSAMRS